MEDVLEFLMKYVFNQAGASGTFASLVGVFIWKKMSKKMDSNDKYRKLEKKFMQSWTNDIEEYIERELLTHRSGLYGVLSRSTIGYQENRPGVNGVMVHRKNYDYKWSLEKLREKFDVETKDAYSWLSKQIMKNFKLHYTKVDNDTNVLDVSKYTKRINKDVNSLYGSMLRKFDTEIGAHDLIQSAIEGYFTHESFAELYKEIITEMEEREMKYLRELEEFKKDPTIEKHVKGKK